MSAGLTEGKTMVATLALNGNGTVNGLATIERPNSSLAAVHDTLEALKAIRTFLENEFKPPLDYGVIPGTDKPTLLLPGAQKAFMYFNVAPQREIERIELGGGHLEVLATTRLVSRSTGQIVGEGSGSCSSMEKKYRWRNANLKCPACGKETVFRSKQANGGHYCWIKKDGCGRQFPEGDPSIANQTAGKVENPDVHDCRNTILKMAIKRADVSAAMSLACLSERFTQDLEDTYDLAATVVESAPPPAPAPPPTKPAPTKCTKCGTDLGEMVRTPAGLICYQCCERRCDSCNKLGRSRSTRANGSVICKDCSTRQEEDRQRAAFRGEPALAPKPVSAGPLESSRNTRPPATGGGLWRWAAEVEKLQGPGLLAHIIDRGIGLGWGKTMKLWTASQVDDAFNDAQSCMELIYNPDQDETDEPDAPVRWDDAREH